MKNEEVSVLVKEMVRNKYRKRIRGNEERFGFRDERCYIVQGKSLL